LAKTEIALDPNVSAVPRRWLDLRKAIMPLDDVQTNPYLFPGRRYGEHITTAAVTYWLRKAGVTAEQLYNRRPTIVPWRLIVRCMRAHCRAWA